ncbi:MAG: DUF6941 family protein [Fimbriimonadaceae bacterium]
MEVPIFLTADMANIDGTGKLNIIGEFGVVKAPDIPYVLPSFYLVIRLSFGRHEMKSEIPLKILLQDEDAQMTVWEGEFLIKTTEPPPTATPPFAFPLVLQIHNVSFRKYGRFQWRIMINERQEDCGLMLDVTKP